MGSSSIKEISSSKAIEINLNRPSSSQDASKKLSSSGKEGNIFHQRAKNIGIIKRNRNFGRINLPVSQRISPQVFKPSGNMRVLALTNVKIELYKADSLVKTIIDNTENDGTYTWTQVDVNLTDGTDYKVRISSVVEPGIYDESEEFTIEANSITVTEPTSSTIWTKGASANITWTSTGTISDVKIDLYKGTTLIEPPITSSTANDGTYTWTPVNPSLADGTDYKVRISSVSDSGIYGESSTFAIEEKAITVTLPTTGTIWTKGLAGDITWTSTGTISDVKIDLYRGEDSFIETIVLSTTDNGTYTWTPVNPVLQNAKNYHVKIICINVPEIYGESVYFEIED